MKIKLGPFAVSVPDERAYDLEGLRAAYAREREKQVLNLALARDFHRQQRGLPCL